MTNVAMSTRISVLALLSAVLLSCGSNTVYSEFKDIDSEGWNRDSICAFTFHIDDTAATYQMRLYIRHRETYPYQNIWLFVSDSSYETMPKDTLLFYLANDRGEWLGQGKNGIVEMPMLYQEQRLFADTGDYTIYIQQAMRDTFLKGIENVGFELLKYGQE